MTQEQENRIFYRMLKKHGAERLEYMIQRREITRKYYRRWPYDGWAKRTAMDSVDLVHPSNPLGEIMADEAREELLDRLTPLERWVAEETAAGFKPRDIAAKRGQSDSRSVRWLKHNAKSKMEALLDEPLESLDEVLG